MKGKPRKTNRHFGGMVVNWLNPSPDVIQGRGLIYLLQPLLGVLRPYRVMVNSLWYPFSAGGGEGTWPGKWDHKGNSTLWRGCCAVRQSNGSGIAHTELSQSEGILRRALDALSREGAAC